MFSPVESQVIVLSKESPIVSVGLRTADVSYTNQNKTQGLGASEKEKNIYNTTRGRTHLLPFF